MKNEIDNLKVENNRYYVGFFSIFLTWMVLIIIGYFLSFIIKDELDVNYLNQIYNLDLSQFFAEKSENIQYMVLTLLFPILFIIFYKIIDNIKISIKQIHIYLKIIGIVIIMAIFCVINIVEPYYLKETVVQKAPLMFLIFSILILLFIFLLELYNKKNIKKYSDRIVILVSVISILFISWLYITDNYYFSIFSLHHFDAYFYPVYKVYSGQTILTDFNCLYGFYPYFLVLVLKLLGGVIMGNFSIIMSILVGLIYLSILIVLLKLCHNKVVALLGSTSVMFFNCLLPILYNNSSQYL